MPPRTRSKNWSVMETKLLIAVWRNHHEELQKTKRNRAVMLKMHNSLHAFGVNRTVEEMTMRLKKLKIIYRAEKAKAYQSEAFVSTWEFYSEIDAFVGDHSRNEPQVYDTLAQSFDNEQDVITHQYVAEDLEEDPVSLLDEDGFYPSCVKVELLEDDDAVDDSEKVSYSHSRLCERTRPTKRQRNSLRAADTEQPGSPCSSSSSNNHADRSTLEAVMQALVKQQETSERIANTLIDTMKMLQPVLVGIQEALTRINSRDSSPPCKKGINCSYSNNNVSDH